MPSSMYITNKPDIPAHQLYELYTSVQIHCLGGSGLHLFSLGLCEGAASTDLRANSALNKLARTWYLRGKF